MKLDQQTVGAFVPPLNLDMSNGAKGPLSGYTFAVKDIFDLKGYVTGFGNPDWARSHPPAAATAAVINACLDAGASLSGKTLTDELAFSPFGENEHYGTPLNRFAPDCVPGGSSSGSVAATAAELVTFAIGSDTGGSVRVPASYCGVFGMRPTHGRVDMRGAIPLAPRFDTAGWFARDPAVMWSVAEVLLNGRGSEAPIKRVIYPREIWALAEPGLAEILQREVLPLLDEHIAPIERERITDDDLPLAEWYDSFLVLQGHEVWQNHGHWIEASRPHLALATAQRLEGVKAIRPRDIERAETQHTRIRARIQALMNESTLLVAPTAPFPAPLKGQDMVTMAELRQKTLTMTCLAGHGACPQISLPVACINGQPVGLSLIAAPNGDETLLEVASKLCVAAGWTWQEGVLR